MNCRALKISRFAPVMASAIFLHLAVGFAVWADSRANSGASVGNVISPSEATESMTPSSVTPATSVPNNTNVAKATKSENTSAPFEAQSIRRTGSNTSASDSVRGTTGNGSTNKSSSSGQSGVWDLGKAVLSLMVVIGVVLGLAWLWRFFINGTKGQKSPGVIQLLSKTHVSPRQSVMLLQAGRRLIVVGTSGTEMNALCQIDNPDEVAEMLAKVRLEKSTAGINGFKKLFSKAESDFEATASDANPVTADNSAVNEDRIAPRMAVFKVEPMADADADIDNDEEAAGEAVVRPEAVKNPILNFTKPGSSPQRRLAARFESPVEKSPKERTDLSADQSSEAEYESKPEGLNASDTDLGSLADRVRKIAEKFQKPT